MEYLGLMVVAYRSENHAVVTSHVHAVVVLQVKGDELVVSPIVSSESVDCFDTVHGSNESQ